MTALVQIVEQTRGHGIGASMAAACLGCSPYLTPIGAWLVLKGKAETTAGEPAYWGQVLEPIVRGEYAKRHGYSVGGETNREIHVPRTSIYRSDLPWLRATPDGIAQEYVDRRGNWTPFDGTPDPGGEWVPSHLVQVKTVDQRLGWHWGLNPRVRSCPAHYRVQAVVEMAVTGLSRCDFAVLCGGNDYFEVIVERDAELEVAVLEQLAAFWRSLDADEPPPLDDADDWRRYFADRLPKQRVETVAPAKVETWLDEWKAARDAAEAAEKAERLARNRILAAFVEDGASAYETKHGRVVVVRAKPPYVKAPDAWGKEE